MKKMTRNQSVNRLYMHRGQFFLGTIAICLLVAAGCSSDSTDGHQSGSEDTQATEATIGGAATANGFRASGTGGTASTSSGGGGFVAPTSGSAATGPSGTRAPISLKT